MPKNGSPMCSAFSKSAGEVATGSAPGFDRCLLIETPRPWAGNVETSITFPSPVMDTLDMAAKNGDDTKLLCVAPDDEYTERGHTTVMLFSRPEPQFATYDKHEYQVPREAVPSLVEALIRRNGGLDEFEAHRRDTSGVRDVLVCTHGSRDACCATRGYPVYQTLRRKLAPEMNGGMRVWQSSHLGGHRFAPNILDLPEGRSWVRPEEDDIDALINHTRPASEMAHLYRGWSGLHTPYEQVVEQAILAQQGWDWTQHTASGEVTRKSGDGRHAEVRISYSDADGRQRAYEAVVEQTEDAPRIDCVTTEPSEPSPQFALTSITHLP